MTRAFEWARKFQANRSDRAKMIDSQRQAKVTFGSDLSNKEYSQWKKNPGRYDIEGIDTPEVPVTEVAPPEKEPVGTEPEPKERKKRNKRRKTNSMEYSESWYRKLPWKTDPERAARMAMEALNVEKVEDTSEMRAYLEDTAYDEVDDGWRRDERSVARAFHNKMWQDYHAQELYDNGMYSEKPEEDAKGSGSKKRKKLTKTQKRDLRDVTALGVSTAGLGLSVVSLILSMSPKSQAEFHTIVGDVYDHLKAVDPKGLRSDYGRNEDRAMDAIASQLVDRQGAETLARRIVATGGKGSRTLAKRIRDWNANRD